MPHVVDVDPGEGLDGPDPAVIEGWATRMLDAAGLVQAEWSVVLTDDAQMARLNVAWRDKQGPTDVLSFPQQESGGEPIAGGVLGDVVISVPTAARQASEQGHDLATELQVLLAHGLAHLLGHDHLTPAQAGAMAEVERDLLAAVGLSAGLVARARGADGR